MAQWGMPYAWIGKPWDSGIWPAGKGKGPCGMCKGPAGNGKGKWDCTGKGPWDTTGKGSWMSKGGKDGPGAWVVAWDASSGKGMWVWDASSGTGWDVGPGVWEMAGGDPWAGGWSEGGPEGGWWPEGSWEGDGKGGWQDSGTWHEGWLEAPMDKGPPMGKGPCPPYEGKGSTHEGKGCPPQEGKGFSAARRTKDRVVLCTSAKVRVLVRHTRRTRCRPKPLR
jgi:hypothetical protein